MLRPYQLQLESDVNAEWNHARYLAMVLPPGGGKTVIASSIIRKHSGASCIIAHRQELVIQISLSYAAQRIPHRIIGPKAVIKLAVRVHMSALGYSTYEPNAPCAVAGVLSLLKRKNISDWCKTVTLWILDETHHLLRDNTWGRAVALFPNARGLGMTGTLMRTDGKGLGSHADGVLESFVHGPGPKELIHMGYLTPYTLYVPENSIDTSRVPVDSGGDFNKAKLTIATKKSTIVGDVVGHYLKFTPGLRGLTFAQNVETASDIADKYNSSGVPAQMVCAEHTSDRERETALTRLKSGSLLQLVNVDLFGEGTDLPNIEVVIKGRPTQSKPLDKQQGGRVMRINVNMAPDEYAKLTDAQRRKVIANGPKPQGYIIDPVGNVKHGYPDDRCEATLDRREKRSSNSTGEIPIRGCVMCTKAYRRHLKACPHCGHAPEPIARTGPEFVDGDLVELNAETIARMRGDIAAVDKPKEVYRKELQDKFTPVLWQMANVKRHVKRQEVQSLLRYYMAWWAGYQRHKGRDMSESDRRFWFTFGIDKLSAQALKVPEALELIKKINNYLEGRICQ